MVCPGRADQGWSLASQIPTAQAHYAVALEGMCSRTASLATLQARRRRGRRERSQQQSRMATACGRALVCSLNGCKIRSLERIATAPFDGQSERLSGRFWPAKGRNRSHSSGSDIATCAGSSLAALASVWPTHPFECPRLTQPVRGPQRFCFHPISQSSSSLLGHPSPAVLRPPPSHSIPP